MKYKVLSLILALTLLAGLTACEQKAEAEPAPIENEEAAQPQVAERPPKSDPGAANAAPEQEPDAPEEQPEPDLPEEQPEPDYIALSDEILTALLGEDAPNAAEADTRETTDLISNHPELEITRPVGESGVVISFDKKTGRLKSVGEVPFTGMLKPSASTDLETMARAWYAALPFPQDYVLRSTTGYGDDLLCYEFNKPVTLETGGEPVELFSDYEAVRIMIQRDTGALYNALAFYWPVFDGHREKTAISETEAVEIAKQRHADAGEAAISSKIALYQSYEPFSVSDCAYERSSDYCFPAWAVEFRWEHDGMETGSRVYVDLYTGEILGSDAY